MRVTMLEGNAAGKRSAQLLTKARIFLKADVSEAGDGWSDSRIAEALDTSVANIERTRQQLVTEGFEAVLTRKYNPNSAPRRIFDGAACRGSKADCAGARTSSRGLCQMDSEPARREGRRTEHRRESQRQHDWADAKKNRLKPHLKQQWVIAPGGSGKQLSDGRGSDTEPSCPVDPIGGCALDRRRVQTACLPTFDPREERGALAALAGICAGGDE